jgi:hypothetical protein
MGLRSPKISRGHSGTSTEAAAVRRGVLMHELRRGQNPPYSDSGQANMEEGRSDQGNGRHSEGTNRAA